MFKKILCLLFLFSYSIHAESTQKSLNILSFNVLAPCWASIDYYPVNAAPYLDRIMRRNKIILFLNSVSNKTDIIALQETTKTEFEFFKQALPDFYAFETFHDASYWSDWITTTPPWEPNGVAIFVKKSTFNKVAFQDLPLTQDGNHSAYFEGTLKNTGETIRAASVHLDEEHGYNRKNELYTLINFMTPDTNKYDIIAGDFNYGTQSGSLRHLLDKFHFTDALYSLHREEWTSPFSMEGDINAGILDHIATRNATAIDGHVINFNLWKRYPTNENKRIIENFKISGSDHFPIFSQVALNKK